MGCPIAREMWAPGGMFGPESSLRGRKSTSLLGCAQAWAQLTLMEDAMACSSQGRHICMGGPIAHGMRAPGGMFGAESSPRSRKGTSLLGYDQAWAQLTLMEDSMA